MERPNNKVISLKENTDFKTSSTKTKVLSPQLERDGDVIISKDSITEMLRKDLLQKKTTAKLPLPSALPTSSVFTYSDRRSNRPAATQVTNKKFLKKVF